MMSLDNLKTTLNAIKHLLTDYPKKKDIPTKLPNPNPLTFTGAVIGNYDGSEALTVEIPSGGSSVPKPLTYDYMPEGYPTKAMETVTLMEEQEVAFSLMGDAGQYAAVLPSPLEIVEGQTYTVKWDGTEYECVGVVIGSIHALGNLSILGGGDDTGEPFLYASHEMGFATLDTSASHTISVKGIQETVTPMAGEFLPKPLTYEHMPEGYPSKGIFNIEWDGNPDGLTKVGLFYKVSDLVVDPSVFAAGATLTYAGGLTDFMSIDAALPKQRITIEPGKITFGEGQVKIFTETPEAPYEAFEIGVYFESDEIYDVRKVTGGEVITPMAEEFIPATAKLSGPIKNGSLLRGDTSNARWTEIDADGGYGWQYSKEINFISDMYEAAEKITYIETDSEGNETEAVAFFKISDDIITQEEIESVCSVAYTVEGADQFYDLTVAPYNQFMKIGTAGIYSTVGYFFSCSQEEDVKDLLGVETPIIVPAGTWLMGGAETQFSPYKLTHGIVHVIDEKYLSYTGAIKYVNYAVFSELCENLVAGKTVHFIYEDTGVSKGGRILWFGGDGETYIKLIYDSDPFVKYKYVPNEDGLIYFNRYTSLEATNTELYLKSSTTDSTKQFKITVDDSGTIYATEVTT